MGFPLRTSAFVQRAMPDDAEAVATVGSYVVEISTPECYSQPFCRVFDQQETELKQNQSTFLL